MQAVQEHMPRQAERAGTNTKRETQATKGERADTHDTTNSAKTLSALFVLRAPDQGIPTAN